jgi:Tfp pilus assembly protein PilV
MNQNARFKKDASGGFTPTPKGNLVWGFTLVETLVVVSITVIITAMMMVSFKTYNTSEALSKDQAKVVSALERARSLTINSFNSSEYGVHFASTSVTIFKGSTYSSSDVNNIVTILHPLVQVKSVNVAGGSMDVVFEQLTGETTQIGTTTLSLKTATTTTKTITIYGTGLIQPN